MNQATGTVFEAEKGVAHIVTEWSSLQVVKRISRTRSSVRRAYPSHNLGWSQNRSLGAASLEICLVADGSLDVYGVSPAIGLNVWTTSRGC